MKTFIIVLPLLAFMHCADRATPVREFIPGTYVRFSAGEYSNAWDTLRIRSYDEAAQTFVLHRHTAFQRIREGKIQPKEYQTEKIMAVFDPATGQLQDLRKGKRYVFSVAAQTVLVGNAEYQKVD